MRYVKRETQLPIVSGVCVCIKKVVLARKNKRGNNIWGAIFPTDTKIRFYERGMWYKLRLGEGSLYMDNIEFKEYFKTLPNE